MDEPLSADLVENAEDELFEEDEEASRCRCGYRSFVEQMDNYFWVICGRTDCWHGPVVHKRRDKAIVAWNRVMGKGE